MENWTNELSRLQVLTELVNFAKKQRDKGSEFTNGWADYTTMNSWYTTIGYLRSILPKEILEDFDNEQQKKQHRPGCQCLICTDP